MVYGEFKSMKIPLFPLNLVLLPNEEVSLHIFESKYKKMISECLENNNSFGVVLKTRTKQYSIGCTAKIVEVLESYDDGEYDIVIKGDKRFSVKKFKHENNLLFGNINFLNDDIKYNDKTILEDVKDKYLNILLNHKIVRDIDIEISKTISYDFTKKIILPTKLKQIFLEIPSETERLYFLEDLFNKVIETKLSKDYNELN